MVRRNMATAQSRLAILVFCSSARIPVLFEFLACKKLSDGAWFRFSKLDQNAFKRLLLGRVLLHFLYGLARNCHY